MRFSQQRCGLKLPLPLLLLHTEITRINCKMYFQKKTLSNNTLSKKTLSKTYFPKIYLKKTLKKSTLSKKKLNLFLLKKVHFPKIYFRKIHGADAGRRTCGDVDIIHQC